jgi:hypothetical protein
MSFSNGPTVVTNGLVLALDAGDRNSYVSGSTTWIDLVGSKNGTLTNGPTFNSGSGGSIVFDGVDDYISIAGNTFNYNPGTTGELSLELWIYPTGPFSSYTNEPPTTNLGGFFGQGYFNASIGWGLGMATISGVNYFSFQVRNVGTVVDIGIPSTSFSTGSWYHLVGSFTRNNFSRLYINGQLQVSGSSTSLNGVSLNPNVNDAALGRAGFQPFYAGCRISTAKLYNRPLSTQEVLQNYNATKGRFGL